VHWIAGGAHSGRQRKVTRLGVGELGLEVHSPSSRAYASTRMERVCTWRRLASATKKRAAVEELGAARQRNLAQRAGKPYSANGRARKPVEWPRVTSARGTSPERSSEWPPPEPATGKHRRPTQGPVSPRFPSPGGQPALADDSGAEAASLQEARLARPLLQLSRHGTEATRPDGTGTLQFRVAQSRQRRLCRVGGHSARL